MAMTWAAGDSQPERFATARGFYVACFAARKRPGKALEGLQKALGRVAHPSVRMCEQRHHLGQHSRELEFCCAGAFRDNPPDSSHPNRLLELALFDVRDQVIRQKAFVLDHASIHVDDVDSAVGPIIGAHWPEPFVS